MSFKWSIICLISLFSFQIIQCEKDIIENVIDGTSKIVNSTRLNLKKTVNAIVASPFKVPEMIGTQIENAIVSATSAGGKIANSIDDKVKVIAQKLQKQEEKFISCVKSEQFDPLKVIVLDAVNCVTSKVDTIHSIIQNTLMDVNITYNVVAGLSQLPKCGEDAKCYADYTSGILGKLGKLTLGLGSIVQSSVFGLASIPISLPVCITMKSTLNPAEVIGKLIFKITKCSTA